MNSQPVTLVWLRHDLRLADNPALHVAARRGTVVPVFIWAPGEEDLPPGSASKWWLNQSLRSLSHQLRVLGSPLVLRQGNSFEQLQEVALETGSKTVYWNRRFEPRIVNRDKAVIKKLHALGIDTQSFSANLLAGTNRGGDTTGPSLHRFYAILESMHKTADPMHAPAGADTHYSAR